MVVSVGALSLVLEKAVTQDGNHHHNAGSQEHCNGHLRGAWGKKGPNKELSGLLSFDAHPPLSIERM